MLGNEHELNIYIILGLLLFTGAAFLCKGAVSNLAALAGLAMSVFALIIWL